jgi:hypothetical protein
MRQKWPEPAALVASAAGSGHRAIAAKLGRPPATVRRWLRAVRGRHTGWVHARAAQLTFQLEPDILSGLPPQPTGLADALTALAAAVGACRQPRLGIRAPAWTLITMITGGRLITPAPSG